MWKQEACYFIVNTTSPENLTLKISKCLCHDFSSVYCQEVATESSVDSFYIIFLQKFCEIFCWGNMVNVFSSYSRKLEINFCFPNKECITLNPVTIAAVFLPFPNQSYSIIQLLWEQLLLYQQKIDYHEITAYITFWSVGLFWLHFISSS